MEEAFPSRRYSYYHIYWYFAYLIWIFVVVGSHDACLGAHSTTKLFRFSLSMFEENQLKVRPKSTSWTSSTLCTSHHKFIYLCIIQEIESRFDENGKKCRKYSVQTTSNDFCPSFYIIYDFVMLCQHSLYVEIHSLLNTA